MSTDRDVPLIWVCIFSDLVRVWVGNSCSRYMHHLYFSSNGTRMGSHFISGYWESWRYSNIDLHAWIMTGSSVSSDRPRTSSRIGYILSVAFQLLSPRKGQRYTLLLDGGLIKGWGSKGSSLCAMIKKFYHGIQKAVHQFRFKNVEQHLLLGSGGEPKSKTQL